MHWARGGIYWLPLDSAMDVGQGRGEWVNRCVLDMNVENGIGFGL